MTHGAKQAADIVPASRAMPLPGSKRALIACQIPFARLTRANIVLQIQRDNLKRPPFYDAYGSIRPTKRPGTVMAAAQNNRTGSARAYNIQPMAKIRVRFNAIPYHRIERRWYCAMGLTLRRYSAPVPAAKKIGMKPHPAPTFHLDRNNPAAVSARLSAIPSGQDVFRR